MIIHGSDVIATGPSQRHGGLLPAEQRWMCVVSLKVAVARYQAGWSLAINKPLLALASCTVGHTEPHKKEQEVLNRRDLMELFREGVEPPWHHFPSQELFPGSIFHSEMKNLKIKAITSGVGGDGLVDNVLAVQAYRPEFGTPEPKTKLYRCGGHVQFHP